MSDKIPQTIHTHQLRVQSVLSGKNSNFLPLIDTCRIDNFGILDITDVVATLPPPRHHTAFVPAAGAASRFNAPFSQVLKAFHEGNLDVANHLFQEILASQTDCPMPLTLRQLMNKTLSSKDFERLESTIQSAKALYPCVVDGATFLQVKNMEHKIWDFISSQIYIAPEGQKSNFELHLKNADEDSKTSFFLEQDEALSTIRFDKTGEPIFNGDGTFSTVPGGHGRLVAHFSRAKKLVPKSASLFIRNIDNIQGDSEEALTALENLAKFHHFVLENLKDIREHLSADDFDAAERVAVSFYSRLSNQTPDEKAKYPYLWAIQSQIFHSPQSLLQLENEKLSLVNLYARPVNVLGQVHNENNDVGGIPCFIGDRDDVIKVCLEGSHMSPADQNQYVSQASKPIFFNPVCIFAEIVSYEGLLESDHPFWVVSQKLHNGNDVFYHEELLSEILGNSKLTNCIFVALPRSTFHPHKTIEDSRGRYLKDWFSFY